MRPSGTDYAGWHNSKCMTIATKWEGEGADEANAKMVAEIVREGFELREMPRAESCLAYMSNVPQGDA